MSFLETEVISELINNINEEKKNIKNKYSGDIVSKFDRLFHKILLIKTKPKISIDIAKTIMTIVPMDNSMAAFLFCIFIFLWFYYLPKMSD